MPSRATRSSPRAHPDHHDEQAGRRRATALPADERRASIISATIELLIERGAKLTTRQIADAAGIAEGTIFRVFPDKDSLVEAAVEAAFDPAPVDLALRAIDRSLALEEQLRLAAEIIQRRVAALWKLMAATGMSRPPAGSSSRTEGSDGHHRPPDSTALAELFEPVRDRLRHSPAESAELFRGLIFAGSHPALARAPWDPAAIVSVLLHGIEDAPC